MSKVWFITGCSKGFGWELTQELLRSTNAYVVATSRNIAGLKSIEEQYPDRLLTFKLDVTQQQDIDQTVKAAYAKLGGINVLVNNAGYGLVGALEECPLTDIRSQFETNLFGLMTITQQVLPIMRSQRAGHIINISSSAGMVARGGLGIYNSSKFALEGFSESLAQEVACFGIKVTILEPGPFKTDFAGASMCSMAIHPDYHESVSTKTRDYMDEMHNNQPGDPVKAAKIMIDLTELEEPPLRLPLGSLSFDRIMIKLTKQMEEFKKYEQVIRSADYTIENL